MGVVAGQLQGCHGAAQTKERKRPVGARCLLPSPRSAKNIDRYIILIYISLIYKDSKNTEYRHRYINIVYVCTRGTVRYESESK